MKENTGTVIRNQVYHKLLNELYQGDKSIGSKEKYQRAKKDPKYFKSLIRKATKMY